MISISAKEFDRAVEAALESVPAEFRQHLQNVVIQVHDRPDEALMREEEVTDDILGIYIGTPLTEQSVDSVGSPLPDRIVIFKENLCEMCESREELVQEIRITLLHEIGHFFGLDEDRLAELGYD